MGRASTVDEATGKALIAAYQRLGSQRAAAAEVGVSKDVASRYFATLGEATAPVLSSPTRAAQRQAVMLTADLWDTRRALDANYARLADLVTKLERGIVEVGGEYQTQTPIAVQIAALREIREHIKLASGISGQLLSMEAIQAFQAAVIEAIEEVDVDTRERIVSRLRRAGALVGAALGPGDR
jgi:hypothetical protein